MAENQYSCLSPARSAYSRYDIEEGNASALQTPLSQTPTLALNINNPADLEAQLLRLKEQRRRESIISQAETKCEPEVEQPHGWSAFLRQEISNNLYLQSQFLILSFATGIMDAVSFAIYGVFVSKQTGNTIFLALAALQHGSVFQTEPNVAVAISLFIAGAIIFGHTGHQIGQNRRLWLLISSAFGTALVYAAAALRYWGGQGDNGPYALGCLALLSFSWGGQVSMALCLKVPDINTTMVTGAIVQVATDTGCFLRDNPARNRRVAFFLCMLGGAFIGSITASFTDPCVGILLAAIMKTIVTVMFLFNRTKN